MTLSLQAAMFKAIEDLKPVFHPVGDDGAWLLCLDDALETPGALIDAAGGLDSFTADPQNFYPGVRKPAPQGYQQALTALIRDLLTAGMLRAISGEPTLLASSFSVVTKTPQTLAPIQSIPHFDTVDEGQLGIVHYLCGAAFGGTAFYRHRSTGFERITKEREPSYRRALDREATTIGLPKPGYIGGDTPMFERTGRIDARVNRLVLYPSNLLHAGEITDRALKPGPLASRRLTLTSFVRFG